jgi:hypothetical protein
MLRVPNVKQNFTALGQLAVKWRGRAAGNIARLPKLHAGQEAQLMTLCDQLEGEISTVQTANRGLLEAVLHDALASAS